MIESDAIISDSENKEILELKEKLIADNLPNWPFLDEEDLKVLEATLNKLSLTEDKKELLSNLIVQDIKNFYSEFNSDLNSKAKEMIRLKWIFLLLFVSFSTTLIISVVDNKLLSIAVSFVIGSYWVYLIFYARWGLIQQIYLSKQSPFISTSFAAIKLLRVFVNYQNLFRRDLSKKVRNLENDPEIINDPNKLKKLNEIKEKVIKNEEKSKKLGEEEEYFIGCLLF